MAQEANDEEESMDVIGALLRSSLLTELGDDEDRVQRIQAAEQALAVELAGRSRKVVPTALIAALDESTSAAALPLTKAEDVLLDKWVTYRNAFPEQPTEILRAVVLAAVARAADGDDTLRQAAWYTLRTAVECLPVGRWVSPVSDLASQWDEDVQRSMMTVWQPMPAGARLRMPTVPKAAPERIIVKTGLRSRAEQLQESGNYTNFASNLQAEFADHVDQLISVSETLSTEAQKRSVGQLREFATALGTRLRDVIEAHDQRVNAILLRSDLLWWRQTAYSARLSCAYSDLPVADIAIAAAVDLHSMVPAISPLAVEHLLADLVQNAAKCADLTITALAAAEQAASLGEATGFTPTGLVDAVLTGTDTPLVSSGRTLAAGRLAVLVFRDLQARRLVSSPSPQSGDSE